MFLRKKKRLLKEWVKSLAESRDYSIVELDEGRNDNVIRLQPFGKVSLAGTDKTLVDELSDLIRRQAPSNLKEGVTIRTSSRSSRVPTDFTDFESDSPTEECAYFIELRFS
jgi:hypothetical protein